MATTHDENAGTVRAKVMQRDRRFQFRAFPGRYAYGFDLVPTGRRTLGLEIGLHQIQRLPSGLGEWAAPDVPTVAALEVEREGTNSLGFGTGQVEPKGFMG